MSDWCWDFGFDWDAKPHFIGARYLASGLVDQGEKTAKKKGVLSPPGVPYDLAVGETLCFKFFNVTKNIGATDAFALSVDFEFRNPLTGELAALLKAGSTFTGVPVKNANNSWSGIFSCKRNETHLRAFPVYELSDDASYEIKSLTQGDRFLMSVMLTVTKTVGGIFSGVRLFYVDPEMVVGGMSLYTFADATAGRFAPGAYDSEHPREVAPAPDRAALPG